MFYECIKLDLEATSLNDLPPFVIDCYDDDEELFAKNSKDYLGRAVIEIGDKETDAAVKIIYDNKAS